MAIKFDPTINAGNLLQGAVLLVTIAAAFSVHDRRISVLEDRDARAQQTQAELRVEAKETLKDIKVEIKELQRSVNDLGNSIAAQQRHQPRETRQ